MGLIEVRQSADNATVKRRRALLAAYLRTSYRFSADGLVFDILVGSVSVALDRWLSQNGWTCWVFISACNPGSRLLSGRVNAIRHQTLISHLADRGRTWFPAEAVPRGGTWPPEQGLFVPDHIHCRREVDCQALWPERAPSRQTIRSRQVALVFAPLRRNSWSRLSQALQGNRI